MAVTMKLGCDPENVSEQAPAFERNVLNPTAR